MLTEHCCCGFPVCLVREFRADAKDIACSPARHFCWPYKGLSGRVSLFWYVTRYVCAAVTSHRLIGACSLMAAEAGDDARAGNHEENTLDSLAMLWRNGSTNAVNMVFFWSVVGLNVFGLMVTQTLGSVFRAVLLTTRTASVRL